MKIAHVTIHGKIHGVGFRQFIKSNATTLGVVGWVQNNEDKTVEAIFQGEDEAVGRLIECCNVGPMLSDVRKVDLNYMEEPFGFTEFEILNEKE